MKITEAFWEKKSLGLATLELNIDLGDDLGSALNKVDYKRFQHVVCKVPAPDIASCHILEEQGFRFVEAQMDVFKSLKVPLDFESDTFQIAKRMTCLETTSSHIQNIASEIQKGIFDTDRVALDPRFGSSLAAERYANWLLDEFHSGSKVFEILRGERGVGFFILRPHSQQTGQYAVVLGGMYQEWKNSHYGVAVVGCPILEAKRLGGLELTTSISTNNLPIIRQYMYFGYHLRKVNYVFRKLSTIL